MKKTTTLIQLSGGVDSTYVIYDWLKNNPNEKCIIHHINIKNHEGRIEKEREAVKKIISWFKANKLDNFTYLESSFDYGNVGYIIKDVEVCSMFLGIIVRNKKWVDLKRIVQSLYKPNGGERHERARKILDVVGYNKKLEVLYPLEKITKKDVINKMPKDLFELCWWCRKPVNKEPCKVCATCMEVELALKK
jgi:7-cyano-7-deazaguanine synthase in queuosine biosynthesis